MNARTYEELDKMLCKELDAFANKGEISESKLETLHKLTDTLKNLHKIEMLENAGGYSNDYSGASHWEARGYGRGNSYDGGSSYASRRGKHYVRGHYSRDGYSRDEGYSRDDAKHEMMDQLEEMMGDADDSKSREAIKRCMEQIRNA